MGGIKNYELQEQLPGEGIKSFKAKEISSGRPVLVHLLPGGNSPENEALLRQVVNLPPENRGSVLEVGEDESTPYVVTEVLPGCPPLEEWLKAAGTPKPVPELTRAQAWKIPPRDPPAGPPAKTQAEPLPPRPQEPGEFTRLFASPASPAPGVSLAPQETPAPPPAAAPGEFTRLFQAPAQSPPATRPSASEPGEFTRLFQSPFSGTVPAASFPPPGSAPAPASTPASPPPHPGEFTRLFGTPSVPDQTAAKLPDVPSAGTSGATQAFSVPASPPPPAAPSGPGEFTRLFATPPRADIAPGVPVQPPASAMPIQVPGVVQAQAPSVSIQAGAVPMAPLPASSPKPASASKLSAYLPLILILNLLFLLGLALIVFFAIRS